jgi:hypothetical protein
MAMDFSIVTRRKINTNYAPFVSKVKDAASITIHWFPAPHLLMARSCIVQGSGGSLPHLLSIVNFDDVGANLHGFDAVKEQD